MRKLLIGILLLLTVNVSGQVMLPGVVASSRQTAVAQNLFKYSEVLDISQSTWYGKNISVTQNSENDLENNATLETITTTSTGECYISYSDGGVRNPVTQNTTYYLAFDFKRGTQTQARWSVQDLTHSTDIVLLQSYYSSTSSSVSRITLSFTTPSGCTSVRIFPYIVDSGTSGVTCYIGRMQLYTNSSAVYGETTTSIIP